MLDSDQRVPGTRPRGKRINQQSHGGRAPNKLACGVGPLQVLRFCSEWQQEEKEGEKRKGKNKKHQEQELEREGKQAVDDKQKAKDETKRRIWRWTAGEPKINFGQAWV